jgi:hypothetical protein
LSLDAPTSCFFLAVMVSSLYGVRAPVCSQLGSLL